VYPHGDERTRAIELGASIFVAANRHLVKAAKVSPGRYMRHRIDCKRQFSALG
jgi:hypothetical protein